MTQKLLNDPSLDYDAVVVGGGLAGINALYRLKKEGLRVLLLEAGGGVGGTWYWNKYPGCRVDIESLEYSYDFMPELQNEWSWSRCYAEQEEVRRYLEWATDRLSLRADMRFNTRVTFAHFDEKRSSWEIGTDTDLQIITRFCVMAVGFLSAAYHPNIPGLKDYKGQLVHSGQWPDDGIVLQNRRVGLIGTGATGVQIVPVIAPQVAELTVFQRTANWCVPINNEAMPQEYERHVRANYDEVRRLEKSEPGAGAVLMNRKIQLVEKRSGLDFTHEERESRFEFFWRHAGVVWAGCYSDIATSTEVNNHLRDFLSNKIREKVTDPALAEKLIPIHPPLSRRQCGETNYYEAFNRDNVILVDTLEDPIEECVFDGVRLRSGKHHKFDVLICATGFDAGVGPLVTIDIKGRGGTGLKDYWKTDIKTHLGVTVPQFPNLFMYDGPQSPCAFFSPFVLVDHTSDFCIDVIRNMQSMGVLAFEPTGEAQASWNNQVQSIAATLPLSGVDSWWMNSNIPGKKRQVIAYTGGFAEYKRCCDKSAEPETFAKEHIFSR